MHFFVVHAGLLPYDTHFPPTDSRQPLTHLPRLIPNSLSWTDTYDLEASEASSRYLRIMSRPSWDTQEPQYIPQEQDTLTPTSSSKDERTLRQLQERSILTDIPQNTDWWSILNIRSVRKNGDVSKNGDVGKPWSKIWNGQMERCDGFESLRELDEDEDEDGDDEEDEDENEGGKHETGEEEDEDEDDGDDEKDDDDDEPETTYSLRCRPATVVYGHSASRGLDIKRWTKGLDTGCLYGHKLTSLILTRSRHRLHDNAVSPSESNSELEESDELRGSLSRHRKNKEQWQFGERGDRIQMKVHSVRCQAPDLEGLS